MTNPDQIRAAAMGVQLDGPIDQCEICGTDSCVPYEVHERLLKAYQDLCKEVADSEHGQAIFNVMASNGALQRERHRTRRLTWWLAVASANWVIVLILWVVTR